MNSKILRADLYHRRYEPVSHEFHYPIYMYVIDLEDLADLDREVPLFGYNRRALVSLHDRDYLSDAGGSIRDKIRRLLEQEGLGKAVHAIYLVTAARYAGYIFNPVSFYYCLGPDGSVVCIVAEVNNTFGERHIYVLKDHLPAPEGFAASFKTAKRFHVSPFFQRQGEYEFFFSPVGETMDIRIHYNREGRPQLKTRLTGPCLPLTPRTLTMTVMQRPVQAVMSIPRIFYQAIILHFKKGLPVNSKPVPMDPRTMEKAPSPLFLRLYRSAVAWALSAMQNGSLTLVLPDGRRQVYGRPGRQPEGLIEVRHHAFFKNLFFGADIGLGEAYMAGDWSSPDLTGAMKVMACNIEALDRRTSALPSFSRIGDFARHRRRANTVDGALQNIGDHYDTSNAFFSLILDPTMTYSCGIFESPADDLHRAQLNKLRRVWEQAGIKATDHVLEIGTGWGGFAVEAVRQTGCAVTTTTISREQYEHVTQMVARLGMADRIQVLRQDYRHLRGSFDKIVSIEMLEAVGHEYYRDYFSICESLLKPGGRMVFQVITIPHKRYDAYRRRADWIQKYIFPGGMLPSREILEETIERWTCLRVAEVTAIGPHYAPTLAAWRKNLLAHRAQIENLGFDDRAFRMWEYYFASCEAGFSAGVTDDIQMVLEKPDR
ncbi:MAG: DUF1365 family protein [Thermodesulfobacteriota bacterium]